MYYRKCQKSIEILRMSESELSELTNFRSSCAKGRAVSHPIISRAANTGDAPESSSGSVRGTSSTGSCRHGMHMNEYCSIYIYIYSHDSLMTLMLSCVKLIWNMLQQYHWILVWPKVSGLLISINPICQEMQKSCPKRMSNWCRMNRSQIWSFKADPSSP